MPAQFTKHFVQDLQQDIKIRQCGTIVFNKDNLSNVITVDLYNGHEEYSGGGSVTGACICPDGSTVPLTGSISGKTASVTLTGDCFAFPGQIGIGIQVVSGTTKTTVLKAIYNVELFETDDMVDPGSRITASVGQLVADIEAATAEIPASDMASLMSGIAPMFSDTTNYAAGAYVYYSGTLYRFTADHAAGSWTGTDATVVALANDVDDLYRNLYSFNASNVLPPRADSSGTVGGNVTYSCERGWLWTFSGSATSNVNRNIYQNATGLPDWFKPGNTLRIRINKQGSVDAVRVVIYAYDGNNPTTADRYMQTFDDVDYVVPALLSKPGLMIRLYIASGSSVDGTVYPQIIYGTPNAEIVDSITEINTSLGNAETDIDNIQTDITGITNAIQTLQTDSLKYVPHPEETYPGKTLAEINDNIICIPSRSIYPSPDTAVSGPYMILRYVNGYNLHLQVSNTTGKIFNRIVSRSDASVYRNWVGVAVDSDLSNYLLQSVAIGRFDNKKIYCDGDSIMYGVTTYNGGVATQTVPQTIALRIPNATVDNKASGGDTIKHTGNISDSISDSLMADTTVKDYDYFVIDGGTNDYTQDVDLGMFEMAEFVGEFSTNTDYTIGQGVTHNNGLYYFTQDHDAGEWNDGHVGTVENYAGVFSPSVDYQAGQYVTYADPTYGSVLKLFQFARQHNAGAWKDPYPNTSPWAGNTTDVIAYDRTFYNGLHTMIRYIIQQTISNNKICGIMLITPIFRNYSHELRGNAYNLPNRAGKTLSDYCDAMCNVGELYCIPVCDSRHLAPFNEMNYKQTLHLRAADSTGYLHPTDAGYKVWGQSIASFFLSKF